MDKASPEVRKYLAQRADLLGAIRLPDNTFYKECRNKSNIRYYLLTKKRKFDRYNARLGIS